LFGIDQFPWTVGFGVAGSALIVANQSCLNILGGTDIVATLFWLWMM
jgi:hypothetical protein